MFQPDRMKPVLLLNSSKLANDRLLQELSGLNCQQTHLSLTSTTSASVHRLKMDGSTFLKVKKRPGKTTTPQTNTCNILSRCKT